MRICGPHSVDSEWEDEDRCARDCGMRYPQLVATGCIDDNNIYHRRHIRAEVESKSAKNKYVIRKANHLYQPAWHKSLQVV